MASRKQQRKQQRSPENRGFDIIFGIHSCLAALANPRREIKSVSVSRNILNRFTSEFEKAGVTPQLADPRDLDRRLGPDAVHQGICLEAEPLQQPAIDELPVDALVVLLDQVTDPHNVGAILRSCAAFNASALITTARHSPHGSAVMTKTASGAVEHVPMITVANLAREINGLKKRGFTLVGLDGAAELKIDQIDITPPHGIVLGAEGKGLRRLTREHCDILAALPLPGPINSLNVSNAAALALYTLSFQQ